MPPDDRQFVFGLIDQLQEYEKKNPPTGEGDEQDEG
jgi:hypothetical protein